MGSSIVLTAHDSETFTGCMSRVSVLTSSSFLAFGDKILEQGTVVLSFFPEMVDDFTCSTEYVIGETILEN
jgi:hypothetical protein